MRLNGNFNKLAGTSHHSVSTQTTRTRSTGSSGTRGAGKTLDTFQRDVQTPALQSERKAGLTRSAIGAGKVTSSSSTRGLVSSETQRTAPLCRTGSSMNVDGTETANRISDDLRRGRINPEQAVRQAEEHVAGMREQGADPRSVQAFYNQLSLGTFGNRGIVNNQGGQSYQNGDVYGSTPGSVFQTNVSDAFQRRADQAGMEARMSEAMGCPVDPNNHSDVRNYMEHVAQNEGISGVQRELNDYMTRFYTHGHSVNYNDNWTNPAGTAETIQEDARLTGGNRRIIDCDGYAAVARELTNGLQGGRYNTQYSYMGGADGAHMMLGVEDSQTGRGFVVDNNQTSTNYTFTPGQSSTAGFRQGVQDSLNNFHNGQEITSGGVGVGTTVQGAIHDKNNP